MGMFDILRVEKDYTFWYKGKKTIIPKNEYQTKSYENMLWSLIIKDDQIFKHKFHYIEHKEFKELDPKRWEYVDDGYEKINFSGKMYIYDDDFLNCFNLIIEDGNIVNIRE